MEKLVYLLLLAPAFISALTIHEFAHAWAGYKLGDDTAQRQGRLTLDPLAHLDPMGTLLIVVAILFNFPLIGWAKPVPFNPRNLRDPRRDSILIAIAGPISNVLQAIVWLALLFVLRLVSERTGHFFDLNQVIDILQRSPDMNSIPAILATICTTGVLINVILAAFNLIPLPPLDGHYILEGLGPPFITDLFDQIRPYSFMILLGLLWIGVISLILGPVQLFSAKLILQVFGYSL
jgi:Zn-dependent protease